MLKNIYLSALLLAGGISVAVAEGSTVSTSTASVAQVASASISADRIKNAVAGKTLYFVDDYGYRTYNGMLWRNESGWGEVTFNKDATEASYKNYTYHKEGSVDIQIVKDGFVFEGADDGEDDFSRVTAINKKFIQTEDEGYSKFYYSKDAARKAFRTKRAQSRFSKAMLKGKTFYLVDGMELAIYKVVFDDSQMKVYDIKTGEMVAAPYYRIDHSQLSLDDLGVRLQLQKKTSSYLLAEAAYEDDGSMDKTAWFRKTYGRSVASLDHNLKKLVRVFIKNKYKNHVVKPDGRILGNKATGGWEIADSKLVLAFPLQSGKIQYQSFAISDDDRLEFYQNSRHISEVRFYKKLAAAKAYLAKSRRGDHAVKLSDLVVGKKLFVSVPVGDEEKEIHEIILRKDGKVVGRKYNFKQRKDESAVLGTYRIYDKKGLIVTTDAESGAKSYHQMVEHGKGFIVFKEYDDLLSRTYFYFTRQGALNGVISSQIGNETGGSSSVLSQEVKDTLAYMYSEESLAHDLYLNIYDVQPLNQLYNIATRSEVKHIEEVNQLAQKYDLNMSKYPNTEAPYSVEGIGNGSYPVPEVQYLYDLLYDKGIQSKRDALEVGCMVEVVDVEDLNKDIDLARASNALDVLSVFEFLRDGSYNHYWAFDKGLKQMGVAKGCCSIPDALGYSFCHPEYPNSKRPSGRR